MKTTVKIVISAHLDSDMVEEINLMRSIKLQHYKNILHVPDKALAILTAAGLSDSKSTDELIAATGSMITQLEQRISDPLVIYDDEITQYTDTIPMSINAV